jgi:hypothetical protein
MTMCSYWSAGKDELNLMGLGSVGGFTAALNTTLIGETFYCPLPADSVRCANQFKITSLVGSPLNWPASRMGLNYRGRGPADPGNQIRRGRLARSFGAAAPAPVRRQDL